MGKNGLWVMNREKANLSLPPSFSLQRKRKFNERRRREGGNRCKGEKENEGYEVEKGKRQERLLVYLEPCSKPSRLAHLQVRWRPTVHVCPCLCRRWESVGRPVLYCWKGTRSCVSVHYTAIVLLVAITYQRKKINYETISQFIPSLTAALIVNSKFNV